MANNRNHEPSPEEALMSVFYKTKERDKKPVYEIAEDEKLNIALHLKEKRKTSVEGVLYLSAQENTNPDYVLTGEKDLVNKEKSKYLAYLINKHKKWLPGELLKDKLQRKIRRLQTLKIKPTKEEKREKRQDGKIQEKEDLGYKESPLREDEELEEFEDLEDLEEDYGLFEDDEGFERHSAGGGEEEYY